MISPLATIFVVVLFSAAVAGQYTLPPFNCTPYTNPPPATNVNQLRPGNIKVVMALGDSISAGFCMHCLPIWDIFDLFEYRGDVFSIGGNPDQYTIPNFLMTYNPNIVGASIGNSLPLDAISIFNHTLQPFDPKVSHLNGAQSEAKVQDVPAQVDYITQQLLTTYNTTVDMENDWKLMTILIGANNICGSCYNRSYANPDYYEEQLNLVLTKIYKQIPRTFVNIITMFNISQVYTWASTSDYCMLMWHTILKTECECLQGDATNEDRATMDLYTQLYNERIYRLAEQWQALNSSTFTVKVQPFTQNMRIPALEFLSEFDCFHPSYLADAAFAVGLWNNMLTPQSQKQTSIAPPLSFICPDEDTFLQ